MQFRAQDTVTPPASAPRMSLRSRFARDASPAPVNRPLTPRPATVHPVDGVAFEPEPPTLGDQPRYDQDHGEPAEVEVTRPVETIDCPAPAWKPGQATISANTQVIPAHPKRRQVLVVNVGATDVLLSDEPIPNDAASAFAAAFLLQSGASIVIPARSPVWARAATVGTSCSLSYIVTNDDGG